MEQQLQTELVVIIETIKGYTHHATAQYPFSTVVD